MFSSTNTRRMSGHFSKRIAGAIFHAATSYLDEFDKLQEKILRDIEVDEATAFLDCNFAPPSLRRDIGILGLLHKRVLGKAHPIFFLSHTALNT